MKIASWNVNSVKVRLPHLLDFLQKAQPDVLCLQEIKATPAQVPAEVSALPGYRCFWHGARAYSGVALLVRASLGYSTSALRGDGFGVITAMFYAWYLLTVKSLRDLGAATLRLMAVTKTLTAAILLPVALA